MARRMPGAGLPIRAICFPLASVLCLVLLIVVLAANTRPGPLDDVYYFKVDIAQLDIPPKLANSTLLKDLSAVSGTDLVGQDLTADSLGLGRFYTVAALASCSHGASETTCTSGRIGYAFDPRFDLKLDQTGLSGSFSPRFLDALASYANSSRTVGSLYAAAFAFIVLGLVATALRSCIHWAASVTTLTSIVATALLLAAAAVAGTMTGNAVTALNDELTTIGITASSGQLTSIGWATAALAGLSLAFSGPSGAERRRGRHAPLGPDGQPTGKRPSIVAAGGRSFELLGKVPTWRRHKYVQIQKQPAIVRTDVGGQESVAMIDHEDRAWRADSMDEGDDVGPGRRGDIQMQNMRKEGQTFSG